VSVPQKLAYQDAEHAEDDRHVGFQRRLLEMDIHRMGTRQQCLEVAPADLQRNRQADRRPQRIAPPTQSQKMNMFSGSMPKASTACALVDSATKWRATAAGACSAESSQPWPN